MKIIDKKSLTKKLKIDPYKHHGTKFFDFNLQGYGFNKHMLAPGALIMQLTGDLRLNTKELLLMLKKYKIDPVLKRGSEVNYYVAGFIFEGEEFLIWFNATHKGTTVDTPTLSLGKYHRFCKSFLKMIKYKVGPNNNYPYKKRPELLDINNMLVADYLDSDILSDDEFHFQTDNRHLMNIL